MGIPELFELRACPWRVHKIKIGTEPDTFFLPSRRETIYFKLIHIGIASSGLIQKAVGGSDAMMRGAPSPRSGSRGRPTTPNKRDRDAALFVTKFVQPGSFI